MKKFTSVKILQTSAKKGRLKFWHERKKLLPHEQSDISCTVLWRKLYEKQQTYWQF